MKRLNPYQRLFNEIKEFVSKIKYPHTRTMFFFPANKLNDTAFYLWDVKQRVIAAKELGYEVIIENSDNGLSFKYRKEVKIPWQWN